MEGPPQEPPHEYVRLLRSDFRDIRRRRTGFVNGPDFHGGGGGLAAGEVRDEEAQEGRDARGAEARQKPRYFEDDCASGRRSEVEVDSGW